MVTGDSRSNTGRDSQTKFEFQTQKYLNILKIKFEGGGSERKNKLGHEVIVEREHIRFRLN
jgi:hypothetical protein